ncbi:MAG: FHA domain-containing protein [Gemmataceae bacterium]|nr:FHA domain-containing protein [Gemmataceae bacterium]
MSTPILDRRCPECGKAYGSHYDDDFCVCGAELVRPVIAAPPPAHLAAFVPSRPRAGTPCIVLYGEDRQPREYFPLTKDVLTIGRLDPVAGDFPDIDLNEWLEPQDARKISRQHAMVVRLRAKKEFLLRPLPGNTGTQIEADMVLPGQDYPLAPGYRFVLGGAARFKFEIA